MTDHDTDTLDNGRAEAELERLKRELAEVNGWLTEETIARGKLVGEKAELLAALEGMPIFPYDTSTPQGAAYESYLRQRSAAIAAAK